MARLTIIKKVVNALQLQRRVILQLECGHNVSIPDLRFVHEPDLNFEAGDEHLCPFCPDAAPKPEDPPARPAEARDEFDALFGGKL